MILLAELFGKLRPHFNRLGPLEVGQPLRGECQDLLPREVSPARDDGVHAVTPFLVGQPDDGGFHHAFAGQQHVLDLAWVHVVAPEISMSFLRSRM